MKPARPLISTLLPKAAKRARKSAPAEMPPIGGRISKDDPFRCIMTFSSIERLKDGSHLGMFSSPQRHR